MRHRLLLTLLGAMSACLFPQHTLAQKPAGEPVAKSAMRDLVGRAKITLPQAIETAVLARPGIACVAELESTGTGDAAATIFEVMILGSDQKVYEVQVDAADRSVRSNEQCTDEEDVKEIHEAVGKLGKKVTLLGVANTARAVLRGTCVRAELDGEHGHAVAIMSKDDLELAATFSLGNGSLKGISLKHGPESQEGSESEEDEAGEEGEKAKGTKAGKGKHAKAGTEEEEQAKGGKGKHAKTGAKEEEEEEEEEGEEGGHEKPPAPKKAGKKKD